MVERVVIAIDVQTEGDESIRMVLLDRKGCERGRA